MKKASLLIFLFCFACETKQTPAIYVSPETTSQEISQNLENSVTQMKKPYVVLVSIDGFRYDYAKKYGAKNLLSFDVKAEKMIPSFPSKTFPNHYAIATGLYPGHNGLVSNEFYDRDLKKNYSPSNRKLVENPNFYKGTPLWVLADEQKMVSASMFWVGSEAPINGYYPTYYFRYNDQISYQDRVNQTIKWLQLPEQKRPHFITLYFSITDDIGHKYGPDSDEIAKGVTEIDKVIGDLTHKIDQLNLPVNIIVVSDHGMLEVDNSDPIYPSKLFPADMKVTTSFPAMVYSGDSIRIDSLYYALIKDTSKFSVFLRNNLPVRYHYDRNLNRIGNLILMPKAPYTFGKAGKTLKSGTSTHGYDPTFTPEMGAIFYAKGPAFKKSISIKAFKNVNVYPLIAKILDLEYDKDSIDGRIEVLDPVLQ